MAKINFQEFEIPVGIDKATYRSGDVRESVANLIYCNVNGIRAHSLALKIYQSEGETGYSDDEVRMLTEITNVYCTPAFIDGLKKQLDNQPQPE